MRARIVPIVPRMMFAQRFIDNLRVIDAQAIIQEIQKTIPKTIKNPPVISLPLIFPVIRSSIVPGSKNIKNKIRTGINDLIIHNTANLDINMV